MRDLRLPLHEGDTLEILTGSDEDGLRTLRHSVSHIMAQAIKRLYPEAKLAIGPAIDRGFYYDIDADGSITPEDLEKIEAEMKKIIRENLKLEHFELPRAEIALMTEHQPYRSS